MSCGAGGPLDVGQTVGAEQGGVTGKGALACSRRGGSMATLLWIQYFLYLLEPICFLLITLLIICTQVKSSGCHGQ